MPGASLVVRILRTVLIVIGPLALSLLAFILIHPSLPEAVAKMTMLC